jgi:hypothetical protein
MLDLLCINVRTGGVVKKDRSITNVATVTHDGPEADPSDDTDSATITVVHGPGVAALGLTGPGANGRASVRFRLTGAATVRLRIVRADGRTLVSVSRRGRRGSNRVTLPRALPRGTYRVSLTARDRRGRTGGTTHRQLRVGRGAR